MYSLYGRFTTLEIHSSVEKHPVYTPDRPLIHSSGGSWLARLPVCNVSNRTSINAPYIHSISTPSFVNG